MFSSSYLIIVTAALAGFFIAFYIRRQKLAGKAPVCPLKADCHPVIFSRYSKFLGMPVEVLGMVYYGLVAIIYGVFMVIPISEAAYPVFLVAAGFSLLLVAAASIAAFLFSIYLTFIQAVLLRQWCSWCLVSAGLCAVIFSVIVF